jgi:2-polyprenyl-3-methyl-5-hydroxy-6-metoxy-1,4-benzoquinol methylase
MNVIHITSGCLSGSPLRIVNALNKHTRFKAYLINTMSRDKRTFFDLGVDWRTRKDEAIALIEQADIIHAHCRDSLRALRAIIPTRCPVLLHHHGSPSEAQVLGKPIPGETLLCHVSIVQYPERYVPKGRLLPNIVAPEAPVSNAVLEDDCPHFFYSPTMVTPSWRVPETHERWMTKGKEEVLRLLYRMKARAVNKGHPFNLVYLAQAPFEACMRAKRASNIIIDDTITGSYHLVGLEGVAMGVPVVGYIDSRIERLLKEITGAESIPWVNVHLEELEPTLEVLTHDNALRKAIGNASYAWAQKYYREDVLVRHFVRAYEDVLAGSDIFGKNRFDASKKRDLWFVRDSFDMHYQSRKRKKQRGTEQLLSSFYMNHVSAMLPYNDVITQLWVKQKQYPMGNWLHSNRTQRIDAHSELFFEGKRESMLDKYRMALPYAKRARVVDFGSGTGYGASFLVNEGGADSLVAVEKDMLSVAYAQQHYGSERITYLERDVMESSLPEQVFDLVVAIEITEWMDCEASFLRECKRVLKPGGVCVISAADVWDVSIAERNHKRWHTAHSFQNALQDVFRSVALYRQPSVSQSRTGKLFPELFLTPLKEGESLLAVCKDFF